MRPSRTALSLLTAVLLSALLPAGDGTAAGLAPDETELLLSQTPAGGYPSGFRSRAFGGGPARDLLAGNRSAYRHQVVVSANGRRYAYWEEAFQGIGRPERNRVVVRDVGSPAGRFVLDTTGPGALSVAISPNSRTVVWSQLLPGGRTALYRRARSPAHRRSWPGRPAPSTPPSSTTGRCWRCSRAPPSG